MLSQAKPWFPNYCVARSGVTGHVSMKTKAMKAKLKKTTSRSTDYLAHIKQTRPAPQMGGSGSAYENEAQIEQVNWQSRHRLSWFLRYWMRNQQSGKEEGIKLIKDCISLSSFSKSNSKYCLNSATPNI